MTTFLCPEVIQGCGIRLTDIDQWGITVDPLVDRSRIFTSGWIELTVTPVTFQRGAVPVGGDNEGEACIIDFDQPKVTRLDLSMKLCNFPAPVFEKLIGSTLAEDPDTAGTFRGLILKDSHRECCADTVMLEIFSKNGAGCDPVSCAFSQWVLPLTRNWTLGSSFTFQNGATEFTLNGQATANPNFWPSLPGLDLPSYTAEGVPEGAAPPIIPINSDTELPYVADIFTETDIEDIRTGGPLSVWCIPALPDGIDDCGYMDSTPPLTPPIAVDDLISCEAD